MTNTLILTLVKFTNGMEANGIVLAISRGLKVLKVRREPLVIRERKDRRVTLVRRVQLETKVKKVRRVLQAIKDKRVK